MSPANRVGEAGIWSRVLDRVLRRPLVSAIVSASVLVALAVPALGMETSLGGLEDASRVVIRERLQPELARFRINERDAR